MSRKFIPLLILLVAFALRIHHLTDVPPGLTHDEANHGREAIDILDGVLLFYFPLNYGSEPLYSYIVAGSMGLLGENLFALRWVNVVFGLFLISAAYVWATYLFDRRVATITAALLAVSFWPLASSREALRAGLLPFFMVMASWFYWRILHRSQLGNKSPWLATMAFGGCVAITLHIYLAARVAWLIFPLFLLYLGWQQRSLFKRWWLPTLIGLLVAFLLTTPMFLYLQNNPEALTRLDMLDGPLQDIREANFGPVINNVSEALLAFVWPGYGDQFLAYNIPGRPTLHMITAIFFLGGLFITLWRWQHPPYFFLLLWFGVGIIPSLITGPTANTTRNLAALPALYMLPAIGAVHMIQYVPRSLKEVRWATAIPLVAWFIIVGWSTTHDYFVRWGQSPEVRGAYQHTLVRGLEYLSQAETTDSLVLSTVYPGPVHDASISKVIATNFLQKIHWVDARYALHFPYNDTADYLILASTPLHPTFQPLLQTVETVNLRADDLDPGFTYYHLSQPAYTAWLEANMDQAPVNFGDSIELLNATWLETPIPPGGVAELLTLWRVLDPTQVGIIAPPAYTTNAALFTHLLDEDGHILSQQDALDAPSWQWQSGDIIAQIHPLYIPPETAVGSYQAVVGIYDRETGERRPVLDSKGQPVETRAFVTALTIRP